MDILNPLQVGAKNMDPKKLKQEFGDRLCFWGGVDTQHTLPFGTSEEVKDEVKRRIEELGYQGGYILSSVHNIQNDVSPQNICTMFDTVLKCGRYTQNT